MVHQKKITILTLWVLGLISLTMIVTPSSYGLENISVNNNFSIKTIRNYMENFEDTTYMAGVSNASGWGVGVLTNQRDYSVDKLDFYATTNPVVDIDVEGQKVYTAYNNLNSGLETIGCYIIVDPHNIRLGSESNLNSSMLSLTADGDLLFAGNGGINSSISTYYVTDAFNIDGVDVYRNVTLTDGSVTDIEINRHFAYYTAFNSSSGYSLRVLNAENATAPINVTTSWNDSNNALGLAVDGNLAYIAAAEDGFYVVDVYDKYDFQTIGSVNTPGNATDVLIDGRYAYIASGNEGIFTIDLADKTNPQIVGWFNTSGYARKLALQGNTLFVADGDGGIAVLDVADPTHPTNVTKVDLGSYVYDVDLFGGIVVAGSAAGLHTLAIQKNDGIADIEYTSYENSYTNHQAWDVRVRGDLAFVAGGSDGFYILDVSDPRNTVLLDIYSIPLTEKMISIDIDGNYAHVVERDNYYIFDISDPTNIQFELKAPVSNNHDIYVEGNIAFLATSGNVYIINVTEPHNTVLLNATHVSTNITSVWVEGRYLYAAEYTDGSAKNIMWIYDISNLTSPVFVGDVWEYSKVTDVYIDGDICYASHESWSLTINITDPTNPYYADWIYPASIGTWGFGPYQFSANPSGSVDIINATDIEQTHLLYKNTNASSAWRITTSGDYAYVANQTSLVIMRHFLSAGDSYLEERTLAQSLEVDTTNKIIYNATLSVDDFIPSESSIEYFMSADGGTHWEAVTPGVEHVFTNPGDDLRWRANITSFEDCSPHLYAISINYFFNVAPDAPYIHTPIIVPGTTNDVEFSWNASTDDSAIDHYEIQLTTVPSFLTTIENRNITVLSYTADNLTNGDYYFRVRSFDFYGLESAWSDVVNITINVIPPPPTEPLPWWVWASAGGGLLIIGAIVVVVVLVTRKRKLPVR